MNAPAKTKSKAAKPKSTRRAGTYHLPPGVARESLLQSAIRLLSERGIGHVSLNDVARDAKLNPALVKYYFGSKEHLFQAVIEQIVGEWRTEILAAVPERASAEETLRQRARATMYFLRRYPYLTRLIIHQIMTVKSREAKFFIENFARVNFEEQRQILQRGIDDGSFRPVDPKFFFINYMTIGDLYFTARPMLERIFGQKDTDGELFEAFADHTIDMLLQGIVTGKRPAKAAAKPAAKAKRTK